MKPLMLPQGLQQKLTADTHIGRLWQHFLQLSTDRVNFPTYSALAYAVTADKGYAMQFKDHLRHELQLLPVRDLTVDVQFHTWVMSPPIADLAIFLDWLLCCGDTVSEEELQEFSESFIAFAWKHPYAVARSRLPDSSDNQVMSVCYTCAVIGYLFGTKWGKDQRAQKLFQYAASRLVQIIGNFPGGGYSLEGSSYMYHVNMGLLPLVCEFMREISTVDLYSKPIPPNRMTIRRCLTAGQRIVGPSGLQLPWDAYGYKRIHGMMGLVYLAARSGSPEPLHIIQRLALWGHSDRAGFTNDDKIWSLIWWPAEFADLQTDDASTAFRSWAIPESGSALVQQDAELRLFQMWDRTGARTGVGRHQVNPNSITMEFDGSPIIMDGSDRHDSTCFDFDPEPFVEMLGEGGVEKVEKYVGGVRRNTALDRELEKGFDVGKWIRGLAHGCIGAHNCIIVNDEPWYTPLEPAQGTLEWFGSTDAISAVCADSATVYQSRYPLTQVRRCSILLDNQVMLVLDALQASAPCSFQWQCFFRPYLKPQAETRYHLETPALSRIAIESLDAKVFTAAEAEGFPNLLEQKSQRLSLQAGGSEASFAVSMIPERLYETVVRLNSWEWSSCSAENEWHKISDIHLPLEAMGSDAATIRLRTAFTIPEDRRGARLFIRFDDLKAPKTAQLNSRNLLPAAPIDELLPAFFEITDTALCGAENVLELAFEGRSNNAKMTEINTILRGVSVVSAKDPGKNISVTRADDSVFNISDGNVQQKLLYNPDGEQRAAAGISTDARVLFQAVDRVGMLQGSVLTMPDLRLISNQRLNANWSHAKLQFTGLGFGVELRFDSENCRIQLTNGGFLQLEMHGSLPAELEVETEAPKQVFVNGNELQASWLPLEEGRVLLTLSRAVLAREMQVQCPAATSKEQTAAAKMNRILEISKQINAKTAAESILPFLEDPDWTVRWAAVEALGQLRNSDAVAALLQLLEEENSQDLYWRVEKWTHDLAPAEEGYGLPEELWQGAGETPDAVKRWRLKAAVALALGQIGDRQAVPKLCATLQRPGEFYPVHQACAWALGEIGDPAAIPSLQEWVLHIEPNTREQAKMALEKIARSSCAWCAVS